MKRVALTSTIVAALLAGGALVAGPATANGNDPCRALPEQLVANAGAGAFNHNPNMIVKCPVLGG